MSPSELSQALVERFPGLEPMATCNRACLTVPAERLLEVARALRDEPGFSFGLLAAHCASDRPDRGLIELWWQLDSLPHNLSLTLRVELPRETPEVDSLIRMWPNSNWLEREVYDFFGVLYRNHPDLRRVFLEDDWQGWPLRKDYQDDFMLTEPGGRR